MHREPRHRLVLDSLRFRVMDVWIPVGDTTQYHVHDATALFVTLLPSRTTGQWRGEDWPPAPSGPAEGVVGNVYVDSSYARQPRTHRVTNHGPGTFRLLAVTSSGPVSPVGAGDAGLPGVTELHATWFTQSRVQLPVAAATDWVVSPHAVLIVQPLAAGLGVEEAGGARRYLGGAGGWVLVPAGSRYRVVNAGAEPASAVAIAIR